MDDAHPRRYRQPPDAKRRTLPWPPCSRAGALAHSWCLINVCQDGIREKPADRWRRLPDGQKRLQPSRSLCFPGKTIRAEGEGWADPAPSPTPPTPAPRSVFWTHDRQRESSQCPWRCGPCQPTADGWPEDCKGVYVREETGTNGRRGHEQGTLPSLKPHPARPRAGPSTYVLLQRPPQIPAVGELPALQVRKQAQRG